MSQRKEKQDVTAEHPAPEGAPKDADGGNDYLPLPLFIGRRVEYRVEEEPSLWLRLRRWLSRTI